MAIDHVHLLLSIPPKFSISGVMGYLKGKSSLMIYQKFGQAKFQYICREFWCRGYYVDTTGKNTKVIKNYISNQLKQDKEAMQLSIDYAEDPFTGASDKRKDRQVVIRERCSRLVNKGCACASEATL